MPSTKVMFSLEVAALWLAILAFAAVTSMALVASSARSDCGSLLNSTISIATETCSFQENLSSLVHHQGSYFQSAHIIIVQAIAACALLVFKPSLWAMAWSALESSASSGTGPGVPTMKMGTFENAVDVTNSPGLWGAVLFTMASRTLKHPIIFVILISALSSVSPLVIAPIYQSHKGPHSVMANLVVGGGVGPNISTSLSTSDFVSRGEVAGRAIINAATASNTQIPMVTFNVNVAPFMPWDTIRAIWKTDVQTVVALNSLDCSASAPSRFTNSPDIVTIPPKDYFAANGAAWRGIQPLFAGQALGVFANDPQMSAVYINSTMTAEPGAIHAESSIIFLAPNGTLEGAQQTIVSPEPTSRITSVDVLVCTSTTTLQICTCSISKGNMTGCTALSASQLPSNASTSSTGGLEQYIRNPGIVARLLSASAAKAYYDQGTRIPMYDQITPQMIADKIPPISYLSIETQSDHYAIPQSYVKDVLSSQTAQGLVQGIASTYQVPTVQQVFITATFGTSNPILLYLILVVAIACALNATLASTLKRTVREAAPMDMVRMMAISRNPQLDAVFGAYSDRNVPIPEDVLDTRVGYMQVGDLGRRVLVVGHTPSSVPAGGPVYKSVYSDVGSASTINAWPPPTPTTYGFQNAPSPQQYDPVQNVELHSYQSRPAIHV